MRIFWAIVLAALQASAFEYGLTPVKVNENVYCYFGKPEVMDSHNNGNMVNSCFVDTGSSWLVVDSGPSYMYAKEALLHVNAIKTMPVSHVINTHIHDDHWLGNGYFASLGAKVVGSSMFKNINLQETPRMAQRISAHAYKNTVPTIPTALIEHNQSMQINTMHIEILHVNHKAHTQSDLLVYIPAIKTLFSGDLIFNERTPSLRHGNLKGWITALETIKAMPLTTLVGGHGTATTAQAVNMTYDYLVGLRNEVKKALDEGIDIEDALQIITMSEYKNIALYDVMHRQNVEVAYRMMEWENE
jgi:glyoxylase-like metal-dependent hydrolase (beta-lactamase superfamily II)